MQENTKFHWQNKTEADARGEDQPADKVMFVGCGVSYGPNRGPAAPRPKRFRLAIWSWHGFGPYEDTGT